MSIETLTIHEGEIKNEKIIALEQPVFN